MIKTGAPYALYGKLVQVVEIAYEANIILYDVKPTP